MPGLTVPAVEQSRNWPIRRLIERLLRSGFRIGIADAEKVVLLSARQNEWPRETLRNMVRSILVSDSTASEQFDAAFDAEFDPKVDPVSPILIPAIPLDTTKASQNAGNSGKRDTKIGLTQRPLKEIIVSPEASAGLVMVWRNLLNDGLGRAMLVLAVCGVAATISVSYYGPTETFCSADCATTPSATDLTFAAVSPRAWLFSALAAAGLLALILFTVRWASRSAPVIERPKPERAMVSRNVAFRVGAIGGPAPAALDTQLAQSIGDLFVYRAGDLDLRALDVDRSIRGVIESGGAPALVHRYRPILPTVIILEDHGAPARYWNGLGNELTRALERRGLDVRHIGFHRTLDAMADNGVHAGSAAHNIAELLGDEVPTVTMVLSDAAGWRGEDSGKLKRLTTLGPVFWFDFRDRELWDASLDGLRLARVPIWETSGVAVEEALRSAFAPSRGVGNRAAMAGAALRRRRGSTIAGEVQAILGPALDWAAQCALVEPVPFGLADKLRDALHPGLSWMAISRLAALPGTNCGPEGLRLAPAVRLLLLNHAARHSPGKARDAATAIIAAEIDKLRGDLPVDSAARALSDLTLARVLMHTQPDTAVRELDRLRNEGLVASEPIDRFLSDLVPMSDRLAVNAASDRAVLIAGPIRSIETLRLLDGGDATTKPQKLSRWEISGPEFRTRLEEGAATVAVFVRDDELLMQSCIETGTGITEGMPPAQGDVRLHLIALPSGIELGTADPGGRVEELVGNDGIAVGILAGSRRSLSADCSPAREKGAVLSVTPGPRADMLGSLHIDPFTRRAHVVSEGRSRAIGIEGSEISIGGEGRTTVTAAIQLAQGIVLFGTAEGQLLQNTQGDFASVREGFDMPGPIHSFAASGNMNTPDRDRSAREPNISLASPSKYESSIPSAPLSDHRLAIAYTQGADTRVALMWIYPDKSLPLQLPDRTITIGSAPAAMQVSDDGATLLVVAGGRLDIFDCDSGLSLIAQDADALLSSLGDAAGRQPARIIAADLTARRVALVTYAPDRLEVRRLERIDPETSVAVKAADKAPDPGPSLRQSETLA